MSVLNLDSAMYGRLLGDEAVGHLLSDAAEIGAMIRAEAALARVQARLGIIPREAGMALAEALERAILDPAALAEGVRKDGVAVPALVAALRKALPAELAPWLHWGATTQDITDLALVLRLKAVLDLFETRLADLIHALAPLAQAHRETLCLARTRTQAAAPTLFGLRVANWLAPLMRHLERIREMRPRLLAVQFGGATGTLAALGPRGLDVMDGLADALHLARAVPWHTARDRFEEAAGLFAMIASSLGTMGADWQILAQSELGEITFADAGGSSTLPQKQNPIVAETLVALARFAGSQAGAMHQAGIHANERDGAAWTLEWLVLPPLIQATGAALRLAGEAVASLAVDAARMRENLESQRGLAHGEAASFALAAHMPRAEATSLVKRAAEAVLGGRFADLFTALGAETSAPVDWAALADHRDVLEPARRLIDRILDEATASLPPLRS